MTAPLSPRCLLRRGGSPCPPPSGFCARFSPNTCRLLPASGAPLRSRRLEVPDACDCPRHRGRPVRPPSTSQGARRSRSFSSSCHSSGARGAEAAAPGPTLSHHQQLASVPLLCVCCLPPTLTRPPPRLGQEDRGEWLTAAFARCVPALSVQAAVHPQGHPPPRAEEESTWAEQDLLPHQGYKLPSP